MNEKNYVIKLLEDRAALIELNRENREVKHLSNTADRDHLVLIRQAITNLEEIGQIREIKKGR